MNFLIALALRAGIPDRFAKAATIAILMTIVIVGLGIAKCSYDRSIIQADRERAAVKDLKSARKADDKAAIRRAADQSRNAQEEREVRNAIEAQPHGDITPRQRARACVILCQQHRATGNRVPASCGPCSGGS